MTWDALVAARWTTKLRYPGMPNLWWMPIQTRNEMLSTGVRSAARRQGVRPRPRDDRAHGRSRSSARSPSVPRHAQRVRRARHGRLLPRLRRRPRARPARYGLRVRDVERGGRGRDRRHDTSRRPSRGASATRSRSATRATSARTSTRSGACWCATPGGRAGAALAGRRPSRFAIGPADGAQRGRPRSSGFVFVDVGGPPASSTTCTTRSARSRRRSQLPPGVRLEWAGQFQYYERARERLRFVVPLTLAARRAAALLEHAARRSRRRSCCSRCRSRWSARSGCSSLLGYNLSVAVWVGHDRARRARRGDRRRDAALPDARAPARTRRRGACDDARRPRGGDRRGRRAPHPPEADDRGRDDRRACCRCCGATAPAPT